MYDNKIKSRPLTIDFANDLPVTVSLILKRSIQSEYEILIDRNYTEDRTNKVLLFEVFN